MLNIIIYLHAKFNDTALWNCGKLYCKKNIASQNSLLLTTYLFSLENNTFTKWKVMMVQEGIQNIKLCIQAMQ